MVRTSRVEAEYQQLEAKHEGESILIVSHGGTLKALICYLIGLDLQNFGRLSTGGNTGLSLIEFGRGRPQLTLLNDTNHLNGGSAPATPL